MDLVAATPKVMNALRKADRLPGPSTSNGKAKALLKYKDEEEKKSSSPTPTPSSSSTYLVKILSKENDLWYNIRVYPYGIHDEDHSYLAKLFFGDKCWNSDVPSGSFIIANQISVEQIRN